MALFIGVVFGRPVGNRILLSDHRPRHEPEQPGDRPVQPGLGARGGSVYIDSALDEKPDGSLPFFGGNPDGRRVRISVQPADGDSLRRRLLGLQPLQTESGRADQPAVLRGLGRDRYPLGEGPLPSSVRQGGQDRRTGGTPGDSRACAVYGWKYAVPQSRWIVIWKGREAIYRRIRKWMR